MVSMNEPKSSTSSLSNSSNSNNSSDVNDESLSLSDGNSVSNYVKQLNVVINFF